jgi:hypothetical protein
MLTEQWGDEYWFISWISSLANPTRQSTRQSRFWVDMPNNGSPLRNLRGHIISSTGDASATKTTRTDFLQASVAESTIRFGCFKFLG